jgi:hypothetical protein
VNRGTNIGQIVSRAGAGFEKSHREIAMNDIAAVPSRIIRAMVIAIALSALSACAAFDTPGLKITGSVETWSGHANKCKVRMTDLRGMYLSNFDVYGSGININWASPYFYDEERGAYPGVNLEISCARNLYASRTITDAEMLASNSEIDLGRITVQ